MADSSIFVGGRLDGAASIASRWRARWAPTAADGLPATAEAYVGRSIFEGNFLPPIPVLREDRLDNNISVMQSFCDRRGVMLAPHAKTTMAPEIWRRQIDAGAWGLTAANVAQARVMVGFGFTQILIANQVVDPGALAWIAQLTETGQAEVTCLVDSVTSVELLDRAMRVGSCARPLPVLLEVGPAGGRAGCRTLQEAREVAAAVRRCPTLRLAGVECFEGQLDGGGIDAALANVDAFLVAVASISRELIQDGFFDDVPIISGGGSSFFDRVVAILGDAQFDVPTRLLLRCGCYVTHDCQMYEDVSPLASRGNVEEGRLEAAVEVWGCVLSRPEPDAIICGVGKRDVSNDLLPPQPIAHRTTTSRQSDAVDGWSVTRVMDHHAFVSIPTHHGVGPGDWVAFGINHPCTTFDKWQAIPVVDEQYVVTDVIETVF